MDEPVRILCVDDERNVLRALERLFLDEDYELLTAPSGAEGLEILDREAPVQIVISDYRMPGLNGVEFLREVRRRRPETVRIVLSGYADTAAVVAAINDGQIYKFIPKPWNDDDLKVTIANALEKYSLGKKNRELLEELRASNNDLVRINERLEAIVQERVAGLMMENRQLALIRLLLEELPLPVLACDPQGRVIYRNRAGEALPVGDLLPPALREEEGRAEAGGTTFRLRTGRLAADDGELSILACWPE